MISAVQFGILPQDAVPALSAVNVEELPRSSAKSDGLLDSRFGALNRFQPCGTCGQPLGVCPSHPGHVTLPMPVPMVVCCTQLTQLLNCVCCNCSTLLATPAQQQSLSSCHGQKKLKKLFKLLAKKRKSGYVVTCPNPDCGWPQPETVLHEPYFKHEWAVESIKRSGQFSDDLVEHCVNQRLNNTDVIYILKSISDDALRTVGFDPQFAHPADMMLHHMSIPGTIVRPTLHFSEGSKKQNVNELTKVLTLITRDVSEIKALMKASNQNPEEMDNNTLPATAGPGWSAELDYRIKALYLNISDYMCVNKANVPHFRRKPYDKKLFTMKQSSLVAVFKGGKMGRYRQNFQGKRVNFCIRTVVTPFPEGDLDQIGIPRSLARKVTKAVTVTSTNLAQLQQKLRNGDVKHVIPDPKNLLGEMIEVTDKNRALIVLRVSQVVERFLENDDYVLVNRQPTLHRPSIMAFRVVIVDGLTVRLNMLASPPLNADCDGDELNVHVVQTEDAQAELEELMNADNHILHPGANRPVFGLIQDDLAAACMLSSPETLFTQEQMLELLQCAHYAPATNPTAPMKEAVRKEMWTAADLPPPCMLKPQPRWSGKQLFSMLLPDISLHRGGSKVGDVATGDKKGEFVLSHGELLAGQLCKKTMGVSPNGIVHLVALYHGHGAACRFLSDVQRITSRYFRTSGMSMGLDDCCVSADADRALDSIVGEIYNHVDKVESCAKRIRALAPDDREWQARVSTLTDTAIVDTVRTALDSTSSVVAGAMPCSNALRFMTAEAMSKGSTFNSAQIMGCLGQTFVTGARPGTAQILQRDRFFPSSALLPTARKRKRDNKEEEEDGANVRLRLRARGFIDRPYVAGLDPEQMVTHAMGGREGLIDTANKTQVSGYMARRIGKAMESLVLRYDGTVRNSYDSVYDLTFGGDGYEASRLFLVNRLDLLTLSDAEVSRAAGQLRAVFTAPEIFTVRDALRAVRLHGFQLDVLRTGMQAVLPFDLETLVPAVGSVLTHACVCFSEYEPLEEDMCIDLRAFVLEKLAATAQAHVMFWLQHKARYCNNCLRYLLDCMSTLHDKALMQPGESIGVLAATSLAEPATQLTLNTFHLAGVANAGMTYGIPRLCEIVDGTEEIRSSCILAPLLPGTSESEAAAVAEQLVSVSLLSVLVDSRVCSHVPETVRQCNPGLFAAGIDQFLRFSVSLTVRKHVRLQALLGSLTEFLQDNALVLADHKNVHSVQVLFVRNAKALQLALDRATSGRQPRAGKRSVRPLNFCVNADMSTEEVAGSVPVHALCHEDAAAATKSTSARPTMEDVVELNVVREWRAKIVASCRIQGEAGVTGASVRPVKCTRVDVQTGQLVNEERLMIDIRGTGLGHIHRLPNVDMAHVVSNNVSEVFRTFGIDAAANVLFYEMRTCFEMGGTRADDHLIALLVNVLTHWGTVVPVTRHGTNRLKEQSVIAKITFEEVLGMLFNAATSGEMDQLLGPSERVMFGKTQAAGTGLPVMLSNVTEIDDDEVVTSVLPECPGFIVPVEEKEKAEEVLQRPPSPCAAACTRQ